MRTKSEEDIAEITEVRALQYAPEIVENAKELGYKTANLQFVSAIIAEQPNAAAIIPKFIGIRKSDIMTHLDAYAPDWRGLWESFAKAQEGGGDSLTTAAQEQLQKLRALITQAFQDHPLVTEELDESALFMVRSTSNEDRVDIANPGGNDSFPSSRENISASIGKVVASYFSDNSLNQRLKSGEDVTRDLPLLACLVQEMVGEGISTDTTAQPPVSGVIYIDHGHIRIQAAPGHGELIVNSKGNFDNYYVTPTMQVYAELRDKTVRMVPYHNEETNKMELVMTPNDRELATRQSIDTNTVRRIANFAHMVESTYRMPMDVEFVYDPNTDQLNIVQARAIPSSKGGKLIPTALSNDFITREKPTSLKGSVTTPDLKSAIDITKPEEILICNTITEAKTSYLTQNDNPVKAIIIKQEAPDTSHEAGLFTSLGIPVLQVTNLQSANDLVAQISADNMLVVDPQHSGIYKLTHEQRASEGVIVEGLVSSNLTPHVSMIKRVAGPALEIAPTSLSELINAAMTDPLRADQLFRFKAYSLLEEETPITPAQNIIHDLDKISLPGSDKAALTRILHKIKSHYDVGLISTELYNQLIHNAGELATLMELAEAAPEADKKQIELYYLNSFRKFEGSLARTQKKNVLSNSMVTEVKTYRAFNPLLKQLPSEIKDEVQHAFLNAVKLQRYLAEPNDWEKWQNFCLASCQTIEGAAQLTKLTSGLLHMDIQTEWININFLEKYEANPTTALDSLTSEYEASLASGENITEASRIIDQIEMQISSWSDPDKFEQNYTSFKANQARINQLLVVTEDSGEMAKIMAAKQFYRQIDIFDLTIKALQTSSLYHDQELQAKRFKLLVTDFWELVKNQSELRHETFQCEQVDLALNEIDPQRKDLQISADFTVLRTLILRINDIEFERGIQDCETIADLHSLVHQNGLSIANNRMIKSAKHLENKMPSALREMQKLLLLPNYLPGLERYETISFDLMSAKIDHPNAELTYNVPMREHSAIVKIGYNYTSREITLTYSFLGRGLKDQEENRWDEINEYGRELIKWLTDSRIETSQTTDTALDIVIRIKPDSKTKNIVARVMNSLISSTFDNNESLKELLDEDGNLRKSLTLIQELHKKRLHDQDISEISLQIIEDGCISFFCKSDSLLEPALQYIMNNGNDTSKNTQLHNTLEYLLGKLDVEKLTTVQQSFPQLFQSFTQHIFNKTALSLPEMNLLLQLMPALSQSLQYCVCCIRHEKNEEALRIIENMKEDHILLLIKWVSKNPQYLSNSTLAIAMIKRANPQIRDSEGNSIAHLAAISGNYEFLKLALEKMSYHIPLKNNIGNTIVHLAAISGISEFFRTMVKEMPQEQLVTQLQCKNNSGTTPLFSAINSGNITIAKILIDAMPPRLVEEQFTALGPQSLYINISESYNKIAIFLIEKMTPAQLLSKDSESTALVFAIIHDNIKIVRLLLDKIPPEQLASREDLNVALDNAITLVDGKEIAEALIEKMLPKQLGYQKESGQTALHSAFKEFQPLIAQTLIKRMLPEQLSLQDNQGKTALHVAISTSFFNAIKLLIEGMTPEQLALKDLKGETALSYNKNLDVGIAVIAKMNPKDLPATLPNRAPEEIKRELLPTNIAALTILHKLLNDTTQQPNEIMKSIKTMFKLTSLTPAAKLKIANYLNTKNIDNVTNFNTILNNVFHEDADDIIKYSIECGADIRLVADEVVSSLSSTSTKRDRESGTPAAADDDEIPIPDRPAQRRRLAGEGLKSQIEAASYVNPVGLKRDREDAGAAADDDKTADRPEPSQAQRRRVENGRYR